MATTKPSSPHPLSPLTASEITNSAKLIKTLYPTDVTLRFKAITLQEPEKKSFLPYLEAEHNSRALPEIPRKSFICYYIQNTDKFHEAIVNLTEQKVEYNVRLGPNEHGPGDFEEIMTMERIALEHEDVKAEIAKLKLPEGAFVIADPWIYGSDGIDDDNRMYQVFLYMRDPQNPKEADSNHYAFPLPVSPVIDSVTNKLIRIDTLPTGADAKLKESPEPWKSKAANEYVPEYQNLRKDLKPLLVVQPEGASFTVTSAGETGNVIHWQKWSFRIGYNQREGPVLYDIRYDGRSLFYRLSLSDMNIPYADPRRPFHKKSAFDLGDAGAGLMANNLKLGCDCLGAIHYLGAVISDHNGDPAPMENTVCIHEQDSGIAFKHMNYRTSRAAIARKRELVVQTIITVANYEYILAFIFNQAGELTYEVRATGILSTQPVDEGVDVPFGTVVHPGVLAVHHQHIFSLRVDPALDGQNNRLVYEEAHAMPLDDKNPHGNGYTVQQTVVEKSSGLDLKPDSNRTFKIQNTNARNPVNGKPVAYKIQTTPFQKIIAHPSSFNHRRAEFSDHDIYVTPHRDDELYAGGKYTNQSRGGAGVRSWASRGENVVDTDIVLYVQFGINHITRVEDFPVMPVETVAVHFKPVGFFDRNPALDVPPSQQEVNKAVLLSSNGNNGCH